MIESDAVKTLMVSSPKEGGQSIIIYLYFPFIFAKASFNIDSLVNMLTSSISAPANLGLDGSKSK